MGNTIYRKANSGLKRRIIRFSGLGLSIIGMIMVVYFSFPLISFQMYLQPVFAEQGLAAPIPKTTILTESSIKSLLKATADSLKGVDYTDARNWFPSVQEGATSATVTHYYLSIPKLKISNAYVSTVDNDLDHHLIQYGGTSVPPNKGTAVVFGHSTLPQLYQPGNYKTIFAYAHTLQVGDEIVLSVDDITYTYKIYNITIIDPSDTSAFAQNYDDNYLTLITCTPPGTTWKRLLIKSRLEKS
jgi:sortase A